MAALRKELSLPGDDDVVRAALDADDIECEEYVDCEPPPSSASDCTIIPDRDDIPCVDVEPPSPPPTARPTHIPPPLVWPAESAHSLSLRSVDVYTPRSPPSPLSPGSLRRHRGRAYPHTLRWTPTHRIFSVPACGSPHREKTPLDRPDIVLPGLDDAALTLRFKSAGAMPKPMARQLTIDLRPPAYVSPPMPDSPTLGPAPSRKRKMPDERRVASTPAGLGDLPVPPVLERTLSECPEDPVSPDELPPYSLLMHRDRGPSLSRLEQGRDGSIDIPQNVSPPMSGGSLATKLAGLRIALPDLSSLSGRAFGLWGPSEPTSSSRDEELMSPLRRMGPAMGLRRGEIEGMEGEPMPGGLSL